MPPKVSILIPCYNSEQFIAETLDSCLAQTYENIEVIVVDDGSIDRSLEIAKRYEANGVKVFSRSNNGACAARNYAFAHSTGDYVIFLDADDLINATYVKNHIDCLKNTDYKSVSFGMWDTFYQFAEEAKFQNRKLYKDYEDAFSLLLDLWAGDMLQTTCYMIPRQLVIDIGGWDEAVLLNQDGEFFARILIRANKALFVPQAKVYYRRGEGTTISKSINKNKAASQLSTFISYRENALAHEDSLRVRKALSIVFTSFIYIYGNKYPDLRNIAKNELDSLGIGYVLEQVPERVKITCKLIGFDNFLIIRNLFFKR